LSTTYKFLENQTFSFQFLLFSKQSENRFLLTVEITTMFVQGLMRGKVDVSPPLFPSQQPFEADVISMEQSDGEIYFIYGNPFGEPTFVKAYKTISSKVYLTE